MNSPQRRTTLYVNTTQGPVAVEVLMEARGLAVTRDTLEEGWVVTHINSGMTVIATPFREDTARTLCLALVGIHDWEGLSFDDVVRLKQSEPAWRRIRAAVGVARAEDAS